jgi:hypothetical protein
VWLSPVLLTLIRWKALIFPHTRVQEGIQDFAILQHIGAHATFALESCLFQHPDGGSVPREGFGEDALQTKRVERPGV